MLEVLYCLLTDLLSYNHRWPAQIGSHLSGNLLFFFFINISIVFFKWTSEANVVIIVGKVIILSYLHLRNTLIFVLTCSREHCNCNVWMIMMYVAIFYYTESKTLDPFHLSITFTNRCPILIIFSLLQTEIICPQTHDWISHFVYSLLLHYLWKMQPHTKTFTKTVE